MGKFAASLYALMNAGKIDGIKDALDAGSPGSIASNAIAKAMGEALEAGDMAKVDELLGVKTSLEIFYTKFAKFDGLGETTGKITDRAGILGAIDNLLKPPMSGDIKDWVDWTYGFAGCIDTAMDLLKMVKRIDAWAKSSGLVKGFDKVMKYLGPIMDGLDLIIESYNLIATDLEYIRKLADLEEEYKDLIRQRDEAALNVLRAFEDCLDDPKPDEPPPPPPPAPPWSPSSKTKTTGVGSVDPNIKITVGAGTEGFIRSGVPVFYTIYFENQASATAPAQQVVITDQLGDRLDWSTVELVGIGFNKTEISIPSGLSWYETVVSVATDPNPVHVNAWLDPDTGVITWLMESVDPVTSGLPEDPLAGFLPPNVESCDHCGEGYVSFMVWPIAGLSSGDTIKNKATIVFDGSPLDTGEVTNTIDDLKPTSSVVSLPPYTHSSSFTVSWLGSDNHGGSGVDYFDVYVSTDGGPFSLWLVGTTETSAAYTGEFGHSYGFYSVATDRAGNRQEVPSGAQAVTGLSYIEVNGVLVHEDFGTGIPETWMKTGGWSLGSSTEPCGGKAIGAPFEAPWAIVDSACGATSDEELYTPLFDASQCTNATLFFGNRFDQDSGSSGAIDGSTDGGATWTTLVTMNADEEPIWREVDLDAVVGAMDARIAFKYSGPGGYWAVDNIWVMCHEPLKFKFESPVNVASWPQRLLISNKGPSNLNITGINITGSDAGQFSFENGCPGVLGPLADCPVDITFTPAAGGSKAATLEINSSDPLVPSVNVSLNGNDVVSLMSPVEGTMGTELTLKGTNYGGKKGKVTIGGVALKVTEWGASVIRGLMSKSPLPGVHPVVVTPKEPKGTTPVTAGNFEVKAPEIVWIDKHHGVAGDQVKIVGRFFGTKKGKVLIGGRSGKVMTWTMNPRTGNSEILFAVPKGLAKGAQDITITNKVGTTTLPGGFTID